MKTCKIKCIASKNHFSHNRLPPYFPNHHYNLKKFPVISLENKKKRYRAFPCPLNVRNFLPSKETLRQISTKKNRTWIEHGIKTENKQKTPHRTVLLANCTSYQNRFVIEFHANLSSFWVNERMSLDRLTWWSYRLDRDNQRQQVAMRIAGIYPVIPLDEQRKKNNWVWHKWLTSILHMTQQSWLYKIYGKLKHPYDTHMTQIVICKKGKWAITFGRR